MSELTLAQSYTLVALNAQRSMEMTTAKKVALRCISAAVILEICLEQGLTQNDVHIRINKDQFEQSQHTVYRGLTIKSVARKPGIASDDLRSWLKKASRLSRRAMIQLERVMADSLQEIGLLEDIPHVLGCDLYFESAGVRVKQYRSDMGEYARIVESTRAEILEEGPLTDETICILWLLRESGCMREVFSLHELGRVNERLNALYATVPLIRQLFDIRISHGIELTIKRFLHLKREVTKTPIGRLVNFALPFIERSQAVFIETETLITNPTQRLHFVIDRLVANGNVVTVLQEGTIPSVRIDNLDYDVVTHAIYGRFPIYGVRLLPKSLV
ncbi:hypothetical protein [Paenibacillus guangzhouensis]|uniref:hypothetical protein n=1 Tax=Paenibacillus guangzhouensis TaxID=1473112 RepID=UPI0012675C38|nr:hypothetical protein [Paenibacillus guangzhouensis]